MGRDAQALARWRLPTLRRMTLAELRAEFRRQPGIGPLAFRLLADITRDVTATKPAPAYAPSGEWSADELEDTRSEWIATRLLGRGDYERLLAGATTIGRLRSALRQSLDWHLINAHARGDAANHARRVRRVLRERFDRVELGGGPGWTLPGGSRSAVPTRLSDLSPVVGLYDRHGDPSPAIERILERAGGAVPEALVIDVLRRRAGLPAHSGVDLLDPQELVLPTAEEGDTLAPWELRKAALAVLDRLDSKQTITMCAFHRSQNVPRAAAALGVAETTVHRRLRAVVSMIVEAVDGTAASRSRAHVSADVSDDVVKTYNLLVALIDSRSQ